MARRIRTKAVGPTAAVPLALLLTAGCSSSVLPPSNDRLEREVEELKDRVLELQQKAAVAEVEMARLRQQIAILELESESEAGGAAVPPPSTSPPPSSPPPARRPPSAASAARIEEQDLEPPPQGSSEGRPIFDEKGSVEAPPRQPIDAEEQQLYDRGYTLYHQGRYVDAETSFQSFLQSFPESDLADNAQYWIGEARYGRGDYRGALAAFRETVNRHPTGNKVPDALLKTGQTLEVLGDVIGARQSYQELRRRYPDSAAALVAGERLMELEQR